MTADPAEAPPLIVGMSGASGAIFGLRILEAAHDLAVTTHLVVSRAGALTLAHELDLSVADVAPKASVVHRIGDVAAPIASGSFRTRGMVIAPCSVRTMSEIATGVTSSLLTRAADVCLKERRPLVLMVRESPLHLGHLRTLTLLAELGAIIAPPVPAFYAKPRNLDDVVDQCVGRALEPFGLDWPNLRRWAGERPTRTAQPRTRPRLEALDKSTVSDS